jgi:hypothetical protein
MNGEIKNQNNQDMKRKLLLIMLLFYILLVALIMAIGLYIQQRKPEIILSTIATKPDESETEKPETFISQTATLMVTPLTEADTQGPPGLEPSMTQTLTASSVSPTQTQETPTPSQPTSTSPGYPINGDGTIMPTATSESYPVNNSTTSTQTPTNVAIAQSGWGGEWWVYSEQPDGSYHSGLMTVEIEGSDLSAAVSFLEEQFNFEGILNQNQVIVVGSWSGSGMSGNFYWRTNDLEQFVGYLDREFGFCGSRAENFIPDPCLGVPSNK